MVPLRPLNDQFVDLNDQRRCISNLRWQFDRWQFQFSPQFFSISIFLLQFVQLQFSFFNCFNFWMIRGGQQGGFQSCKVGRWQFDRWQFERRATIFRGMHLILPSMPIHRSMSTWITIARRVIDWFALLPVLGTQRWAKLSWRWPKIEIELWQPNDDYCFQELNQKQNY